MEQDKDWRDVQGFYRSDLPCRVCGNQFRTGMEPRFGYTVCEAHSNVRPVDIPLTAPKQVTKGRK